MPTRAVNGIDGLVTRADIKRFIEQEIVPVTQEITGGSGGLLPGAGLLETPPGSMAVGEGDGVAVSPDAVAVDSTVLRSADVGSQVEPYNTPGTDQFAWVTEGGAKVWKARTNWQGDYADNPGGQFYKQDAIYDQGWLMIANKDTQDRPAPQPVGSPTWGLPDAPSWGTPKTLSAEYVGTGTRFELTGTQAYLWSALRVWIPNVGADYSYVAQVINESGAQSIRENVVVAKPAAPGWVEVNFSEILLFPGDKLVIGLYAENSSSTTPFDEPWTISISNNRGDPGSGNLVVRGNGNELYINDTDNETDDNSAALDLLQAGMTLEVGGIDYLLSAIRDAGVGWTGWNTQRQGGSSPPTGSQRVKFDAPVAGVTDYVEITDALPAPSGGVTAESIFTDSIPLDDPGATIGNEQFGIDSFAVEMVASPDWDIAAHSESGAGGSGGGGLLPGDGLQETPAGVMAVDGTVSRDPHTHLHTEITDFDAGVQTNKLNELAQPDGVVDMSGNRLQSLGPAGSGSDAINKDQLDALSTVYAAIVHSHLIADVTGLQAALDGKQADVLTTKGDLVSHNGSEARLPVGAAAQVLTVDSAETLGVKWATPVTGYTPPPYQATLPGSPSDEDEVYLIADATAGVIWHLRYNAGSASAHKWEFVGGSALFDFETASESRDDAAYAGLTTAGPSITVPLAGDYDVSVASRQIVAAGDNGYHSYDLGGLGPFDSWSASTAGLEDAVQNARVVRHLGVAASAAIVSEYRSVGGSVTFDERQMRIIPIRVS